MLANGIELAFKETDAATTYTNLAGLKEVPEMGADPEKVDVTDLASKNKKYEYGIGDYGDLAYKFNYENGSASSSYRILRKFADEKKLIFFQQKYPDGTKFIFKAQCSVKLGGGGVNAAIEFTLTLALQSDIDVVDPTSGS